jgi:hypothetical protein
MQGEGVLRPPRALVPFVQSGLWGSDADGGGPTPSSAPLHLFTSSTDIGALVLRP